MGFYPCSAHGAMFRGAASAAYPAIVQGGSSERAHLRMCSDCFHRYLAEAELQLMEVDYTSKAPASGTWPCIACGATDSAARLFLTAYPKGQEERSFYGGVCEAHVAEVAAAWLDPTALGTALASPPASPQTQTRPKVRPIRDNTLAG